VHLGPDEINKAPDYLPVKDTSAVVAGFQHCKQASKLSVQFKDRFSVMQCLVGNAAFFSLNLKLHLFDLLWICCGYVVQQVVGLVVKLWICCGFFVQLF
jgi:hypothetical protein